MQNYWIVKLKVIHSHVTLAGSSAPELFTSVAGVTVETDVGVGTIVGLVCIFTHTETRRSRSLLKRSLRALYPPKSCSLRKRSCANVMTRALFQHEPTDGFSRM